jgi:hypothetical protein
LCRDLGVGIRSQYCPLYRLAHHRVEAEEHVTDGETVTRYSTPYGELTTRDRLTREVGEGTHKAIRVEHLYKSADDYDALMFLLEDTGVVGLLDECGRIVDAVAGDGLAYPTTGRAPAHHVMLELMGYELFYYELQDHPSQLETLIEAVTHQKRQILALAAGCPAPVVQVGGNYVEHMTPPAIFERFIAPFYREAKEILDTAGKTMVVHGDGEMKGLLRCLMDCGVEVVEAVTPHPMTSIDVRMTRDLWKDRVTMWGGVPAIIMTSTYTDDEFARFLRDLFDAVAPGDRFILGYGDNVPTDGLFDRIVAVADFWKSEGAYPLTPGN